MAENDTPRDVELSDPRALRAYAHPLRLRLVGLLREHATLTATEAARLLDESSGSCSFHLRQLARYGLVEEVPEPGRTKPWRATARQTIWNTDRLGPEGAAAAQALAMSIVGVYSEILHEWVERRPFEPTEWSDAGWVGDHLITCTTQELTEIRARVDEILHPFDVGVARPNEGRRVVNVVAFAAPRPTVDRSNG